MRLLMIVSLLMLPISIFAQEVAPVLSTVPEASSIQQIIVTVVGLLLTTLVVPWLNNLRKKASAESKSENLTKFEKLKNLAYDFAFTKAITIVEQDFPVIIERAQREKLSKEVIKQILYGLGKDLKSDLVVFFKAQGIDIIEELGEEYVDHLIRYVADKVSPFQGIETATALVSSGAQTALRVGLEKVKELLK